MDDCAAGQLDACSLEARVHVAAQLEEQVAPEDLADRVRLSKLVRQNAAVARQLYPTKPDEEPESGANLIRKADRELRATAWDLIEGFQLTEEVKDELLRAKEETQRKVINEMQDPHGLMVRTMTAELRNTWLDSASHIGRARQRPSRRLRRRRRRQQQRRQQRHLQMTSRGRRQAAMTKTRGSRPSASIAIGQCSTTSSSTTAPPAAASCTGGAETHMQQSAVRASPYIEEGASAEPYTE